MDIPVIQESVISTKFRLEGCENRLGCLPVIKLVCSVTQILILLTLFSLPLSSLGCGGGGWRDGNRHGWA